MGDIFFVDWELWQQMSFCLACLICIVIMIGIFRLHYLNWKSKRIMLEDAEKRGSIKAVRRTGARVRRTNDIPFGVRAIESGIQVDGIWISRPTTPVTPSEKRFASLSTLVTDDAQGKGKDVQCSDQVETASIAGTAHVEAAAPTGFDLADASSPTGSPRMYPNDFYRPRQPSQLRNVGDSDEGMQSPETRGRMLDTYIPNQQQQRRPAPPSQRTSASSEPEHYQSPAFQNHPYQQRQVRDYSPSMSSSRTNARTPDPFASGSRTNSLSGYPTMEYTDNAGMPQPPRSFVPGPPPRR